MEANLLVGDGAVSEKLFAASDVIASARGKLRNWVVRHRPRCSLWSSRRTSLLAVLGEQGARVLKPRRVAVPVSLSVPALVEVPFAGSLYGGVTWCLASKRVPAPHEGYPCSHLPAPCRGKWGAADLRRRCGARNLKLDVTSPRQRGTMERDGHRDNNFAFRSQFPVQGQGGYGIGEGKKKKFLVFFSCYAAHGRRRTSGLFYTFRCLFYSGCMYVARFVLAHSPAQETFAADLQRGSESERGSEEMAPPPCICTRCQDPDERSVEPLRKPTRPFR